MRVPSLTCMYQPVYQPVYGNHPQLLTELLMKTPVLLLTLFTAVVHIETPCTKDTETDDEGIKNWSLDKW